jgi:hypothetical protein
MSPATTISVSDLELPQATVTKKLKRNSRQQPNKSKTWQKLVKATIGTS